VTIISPDGRGIAELAACLSRGVPVVVPLPSPLPYVVAGTDPGAVNAAKGRPRTQPVGAVVSSLAPIAPAMQLDTETVDLVWWLCFVEEAGVLVPVDATAPPWLAPATVDGMAFLGGAWLPELSALAEGPAHLYMSSGNATSGEPAVTAAQAEAAFGGELLVADGDAFRDPSVAHGSSTMIAVRRRRQLTVVRPGINNLAFGDDHAGYVADLHRRWHQNVLRRQ
jgi:tRNA A37 threonylcarbamoyladenosine synthetase subunit TsaC/SUA5/YrdC